MADIETLDGVISGNINTISQITSSLSPVRSITASLHKTNGETSIQLTKVDGELIGQIVSTHNISGNVSRMLSVQGGITTAPAAPIFPYYQGVYEVTPLANLTLELQTSHKILENNIIVNQIPYFQVSNTSGGYTVTIG